METINEEEQKLSQSSEDGDRVEMPWQSREETFLENLKEDCIHLSNCHEIASKSSKCKYTAFQLPVVILPLVLAGISPYLPEGYNALRDMCMLGTGLLSGISSFFNFGKKQNQHNEFSGKYQALSAMIHAELIKPRRFRTALDVFLERVTTQKSHLDDGSPVL